MHTLCGRVVASRYVHLSASMSSLLSLLLFKHSHISVSVPVHLWGLQGEVCSLNKPYINQCTLYSSSLHRHCHLLQAPSHSSTLTHHPIPAHLSRPCSLLPPTLMLSHVHTTHIVHYLRFLSSSPQQPSVSVVAHSVNR
jgi:hypothetical protein